LGSPESNSCRVGTPAAALSRGTGYSSRHRRCLALIYEGELQARSLGGDVQAFDEAGSALIGEVGELVITQPLPSMPPRCCWASVASGTVLADTFPAMRGLGGAAGGQRTAGAEDRFRRSTRFLARGDLTAFSWRSYAQTLNLLAADIGADDPIIRLDADALDGAMQDAWGACAPPTRIVTSRPPGRSSRSGV
jgi:hypothetical protein